MIDTKTKLDLFLGQLLKDYPEHYVMYSKFLISDWVDITHLFNVYDIMYAEGEYEWVIEYPGSIPTIYPYEEFIYTLNVMLNKWPISDRIKKQINTKKQKLETHFEHINQ